jgi:hypothetical protein
MMLLSREDILLAEDLKKERVEIPEWGGYVYVSTMTGLARDKYESSLLAKDEEGKHVQDLKNMRAKLVCATVVDDQGNLLLNEEDVEAIGGKNAAVLDRITEASSKLNAVTDEDLEEIAKNS